MCSQASDMDGVTPVHVWVAGDLPNLLRGRSKRLHDCTLPAVEIVC